MTQLYGYSYLDMRNMHTGDVNMAEIENTRFRSFAERYIVERAHSFETGKEDEGIWKALQEAKRAYHMIERSAREVEKTLQDRLNHEYQQVLQGGNAGQATPSFAEDLLEPAPGSPGYLNPYQIKQQIRKLIGAKP